MVLVVVGVISMYLTVRYIKWGKYVDVDEVVIPDDEHQRIRLLLNALMIRIGLILLALPAWRGQLDCTGAVKEMR